MALRIASITPENIAGLVVGEGCFYCESAADPKYKLGWRLRPAFCIEMRADERDVLEAVKRQLGCGNVYHLDFGRYRSYEDRGWQPHAKYRVSSVSDLHRSVVPFFDTNPLFGRKKQAFEIFRDLVHLLNENRHLTEPGLSEGIELAGRLGRHNARGMGGD